MTRRGTAPDPAFAALVRQDVFSETTPEERAMLRDADHLEIFQIELVRVIQTVIEQLKAHNDGSHVRDKAWRDSAVLIQTKYTQRHSEVRPLLRDLRARWQALDAPALYAEISRVRGAIRAHRAAAEAAGIEPEPHDEVLWSMIGKPRD